MAKERRGVPKRIVGNFCVVVVCGVADRGRLIIPSLPTSHAAASGQRLFVCLWVPRRGRPYGVQCVAQRHSTLYSGDAQQQQQQ